MANYVPVIAMSKTFCSLCMYYSCLKGNVMHCYYPFTEHDVMFANENGILLDCLKLFGNYECPYFDEEEFVQAIKKAGWYRFVYGNEKRVYGSEKTG